MSIGGYTVTGDHLTEINGYAEDNLNYYQVQLYNTTSDGPDASVCCSYNVPRHINIYAHIHLPANVDYDLTTLTQVVNAQNLPDATVINYKYDFKNGMLTSPKSLVDCFGNPGDANIGSWTGFKSDPLGYQMQTKAENKHAYHVDYRNGALGQYAFPIEKSAFMQMQATNDQSPNTPPWLYFGGMPVQSNPIFAPAATFTSCVHTWQIETELDVTMPLSPIVTSSADDPYYPISFVDHKWFDVLSTDNLKVSYNSKYGGRYVYNVSAPAEASVKEIESATVAQQKDKKKIVI